MKIIRLKRQPKGIVRVVFRIGTIVGLVLALYIYQIRGTNAQSEPGASNTSSYIHEQLDESGVNTLTICDPNDSTSCITMKDRNEGATSNDITKTSSYGNYYQWGKNEGYGTYSSVITGDSQINCSENSPSNPISSSVFIVGYSDYCTTATRNDNLRGGSGDSQANDRGLNSLNPITGRQGPCPEGYHVPSIGEWNKVLEYWAAENNVRLQDSWGLKYKDNLNGLGTKFLEDLNIPFAGRQNHDAEVIGVGGWAGLGSSSPQGYENARYIYLGPNGISVLGYGGRAFGFSVRCFKNFSFSGVIVEVVDGKNTLYKGIIVSGSKISDNADVMAILNQDMTKTGFTFLGWYDEDGEEIDLNLILTKNTKIIAKWRGDYIYEKKVKGINTLTICDPDDENNCITMKDRNEGATKAGTECSESDSGACGYHFQWGNNYGFAPNFDRSDEFPNGETVDYDQIDCGPYSPSTPLESSTFIVDWVDYCIDQNDNMWGGSGDNEENNRGYPLTLEQAENRRGPCDTGYHVPSIGEWNQVLEYWSQENEIELEEGDGGLKYNYTTLDGIKFQEDFKIPFAGFRYFYDAEVGSVGGWADLWSSSPIIGNVYVRTFSLDPGGANAYNIDCRAVGLSVRCFKDIPLSLPFSVVVKVMDGDNVVWEGEVDTQQTLPEDVIAPMLGHENTKVGYTFSGWYYDEADSWRSSENIVETGFTLRAVWTVNNYTVTVVSNNTNLGTISSGGVTVPYGATITFPSTNTVKIGDTTVTATPNAQTAQWIYEFVDWTNTCGDTVTTGCTITANFKSTLNKYEVVWKNYDGTVIETDNNVVYGTIPTYDGATPTSGGNAQYSYTFKGWTPSISSVTGNITYTATYTQNINKYTVTWRNSDGTTLETDTDVPYGTIPTYDGATPTKPKDAQYTYVFTTWSPTITAVHGNQEYTAQFSNTTDNYTVTVVSNNTNSGTVTTGTITVPYGTSINTSSSILTIGSKTSTAIPKTQTAQWTYQFVDWTNTCGNTISAGCTITANFKSTLRSYTIIWKDGDGVVVERDNNVPYGATPTYNGSTPTKTDTKQYTYTFSTWSPVISEVRGNQEYTAQFNSEGKDKGEDDISHHSADEIQYDASKYDSLYSYEMNQAYQYSYHYEITSKESISKADMTGKLTRIATAKMLSQYAINVLGMTPDTTKQVPFTDVSAKLDADYDNGVTLAYQLGIMGINMPNNEFRPYDTVSRAEFVTAFSRMRYGILDGKDVYYSTHMKLLYDLGIISNANPSMKEIRGYVMLILMRSDKNN